MNIRLISTDKPTGMVTFLPAGGSGDEGSGKGVEQPGVPAVVQVDEPVPGVQEALAGVDDLGSDLDILEAPQANPANNMIQSLNVRDFEPSFPKPFSKGDSSDSDDTYMNEKENDQKNYNKAVNTAKSLQDRYTAADKIHKSCKQLRSDAFFNIATSFSIAKNDLRYLMNIEQGRFLPLEAAKRMTVGSTIQDSRKQALAFYMIAINPAVPTKFRYEAVMEIGECDTYNYPYQDPKMDAFQKIAEDTSAEIEYRVRALRELKKDGINDEKLAIITQSIAECWTFQDNTDKNWELFEDLYKLDDNEDEEYGWIPDEYREEEQTPKKNAIHPLQLEIIEIIINNNDLNQGFRTQVANDKLKDHDYQQQALENIQTGQNTSLSMAENSTKSGYNIG